MVWRPELSHVLLAEGLVAVKVHAHFVHNLRFAHLFFVLAHDFDFDCVSDHPLVVGSLPNHLKLLSADLAVVLIHSTLRIFLNN